MAEPTAPTARELEIIFVAFQCLKDTPKVDYEKLASTGLYKNAHSASSNWSTLRKKIFRSDGVPVLATGGIGSGSTAPRTPRKNAAAGAGKGTPKSGGRGNKGKKGGKAGLSADIVGKGESDSDVEAAAGVKRERDDDGEGEEEMKKVKRGEMGGKNVMAELGADDVGEVCEEDVHDDGEC